MSRWDPSKTFKSIFNPMTVVEGAATCDKISDSFKQSNVKFLVAIVSHGGILDYGINAKVRQPVFKTGCNVIYPTRYGTSSITYGSTLDLVSSIQSNLPVQSVDDGSSLKGEQLIESLKKNTSIKKGCYRQYDVGSSVPNLEIFTTGEYFRGDGIYVYDIENRTFIKLTHLHMKQLKLHRIKKHLSKINKPQTLTSPAKQITMNLNPRFKTTTKFKKRINQPTEQPLTLSDLCDVNHGTLKNLRIDSKPLPLAKTAVLVIACRSESEQKNFQVKSPTSADYLTDQSNSSASNMGPDTADDNPFNPFTLAPFRVEKEEGMEGMGMEGMFNHRGRIDDNDDVYEDNDDRYYKFGGRNRRKSTKKTRRKRK